MRLLFLGDSLVEYYDWQCRFPAHQVVRRGFAGESAAGLAARLPGLAAECRAAEGVVLMIGTNNLLAGDLFFLPDYEKILALLVRQSPGATLLATTLPPLQVPWLADSALPRLNALLADRIQRGQARPLDLFAALRKGCRPLAACFLSDGIHLSEAGYQVWADLIETNL